LAVEIGGSSKTPEYCVEGHILQITVDRDEEGTHTLSLVRKNSRQPFRAREIKALGHVVPMVRILLRKEKRLTSSRSFNSVSWNILNQLSLGIILVNTSGHVTAANQAAVMLFEAANHFSLNRGRIACVRASDNEALRAALLELAASDVLLNRTMRVSDAGGMEYLNLLMIRVDNNDVELGENGPNLAVFVTAPNMFRGPSESHIQGFYGLTRVEAAVVRLLCLGYDPTTTAKELRVSVNTIRGYLKNVFQKMGVRRQSDMIRMAMCYSGVFADSTSKPPFVGRRSQVTASG
jgi:DNA-binding CsgD family transcriptional regulator